MRKINPIYNKKDTFKYSILISLHQYDINYHPERLTKLKSFENKYDFTTCIYATFEENYPTISLTLIDEDNNTIHKSINYTDKKALIVKLKDNTYASLKPITPLHNKFDNMFKKYSHKVLTDYIMSKIVIQLLFYIY